MASCDCILVSSTLIATFSIVFLKVINTAFVLFSVRFKSTHFRHLFIMLGVIFAVAVISSKVFATVAIAISSAKHTVEVLESGSF